MRNKFFDKLEQDLIDKNTRKVSDEVSRDIACSLKGVLSDDLIAKHTGLSIEVVKKL